jgi:membrane protein YdbS with pleckstrin-like domain
MKDFIGGEFMDLFIERLSEVLFFILGLIFFVGIMILPFWILSKIVPMTAEIIVLVIVFAILIYYIWKFIYWLFIEPFKYSKK